jgi:hypothetical protein
MRTSGRPARVRSAPKATVVLICGTVSQPILSMTAMGHSRLGRASGASSDVRCTPKAEANSEYHPEVAARRSNPYPASAVSASRTQ